MYSGTITMITAVCPAREMEGADPWPGLALSGFVKLLVTIWLVGDSIFSTFTLHQICSGIQVYTILIALSRIVNAVCVRFYLGKLICCLEETIRKGQRGWVCLGARLAGEVPFYYACHAQFAAWPGVHGNALIREDEQDSHARIFCYCT